ncbi:hypothetical protein GCM10010404_58850 [Nonomuraea africana]|uniref:Anti-sigma factor (TIGR02949 family) n=1 Tax=Nonomuraea africana TaxID=46171 RepID=A0ABR9KBU0_9ACTN|nr:zf-HC2 domain-containing protein [Nonomuraea africana]MBE1559017.1 anti-sigma factor (TIGR02949 family) [Nonomuraea africana]
MISCAEAVRQLWDYLDAVLDEVDRTTVEEHLRRCRRCCGELEFAVELRRFLARAGGEVIPTDILRRLNDTLEELGP